MFSVASDKARLQSLSHMHALGTLLELSLVGEPTVRTLGGIRE